MLVKYKTLDELVNIYFEYCIPKSSWDYIKGFVDMEKLKHSLVETKRIVALGPGEFELNFLIREKSNEN